MLGAATVAFGALKVACTGTVVGFGSSEVLAAAYGIAVTVTMVNTALACAKVAVS